MSKESTPLPTGVTAKDSAQEAEKAPLQGTSPAGPSDSNKQGGGGNADEACFQEPIHLLRPSQDHRSLVAEPSAMQRLRALGPVSVLAVIGNQRGGKSTLMNLLHGRRLQGFQMGHYMDPQTFGLWIWPKPHPRKPGTSIILVDSEGLDSPHVPQHYNWLISAVTLLMSDVFMYQTKGSIEQSAADRLDMILKVAEQLQNAGKGEDGRAARGNFIWLLRDHQLQMKRTPREELMDMLDPVQVRSLKRVFDDFDCVPLPRPAKDDLLKTLDQQSFGDLSPDFREEFVCFERRLLQLLDEPRNFFGSGLTGAGLAEVLSQYLAAIQQQKGVLADICQMPTQRELLRQLASKRAVKSGIDRYEQQLRKAGVRGPEASSRLPIKPLELLASHESARDAAIEAFLHEAASGGLEDDEAREAQHSLEEQLACWGAGLEVADVGKDLEGKMLVDVDIGEVPPIVRTTRLQGGLLLELWTENAKRAKVAYDGWLSEFCGSSSSLTSLEDHYNKLTDAVAAAEESRIGPWGALHAAGVAGREQRQLLLNVARQGDRIVLKHIEDSEAQSQKMFSGQLDALRTEQVEERSKAIDAALQTASGEAQRLVEAADVRQEAVAADLRGALKAAEANREAADSALEARLVQRLEDLERRLAQAVTAAEQEVADRKAAIDDHAKHMQSELATAQERWQTVRHQDQQAEKARTERWETLREQDLQAEKERADRWEALRLEDQQGNKMRADQASAEVSKLQGSLAHLEEECGRLVQATRQLSETQHGLQETCNGHDHLLKKQQGDCGELMQTAAQLTESQRILREMSEGHEKILKQQQDECSKLTEAVTRSTETQHGLQEKCECHENMLKKEQEECRRLAEAMTELTEGQRVIQKTCEGHETMLKQQINDCGQVIETSAQLTETQRVLREQSEGHATLLTELRNDCTQCSQKTSDLCEAQSVLREKGDGHEEQLRQQQDVCRQLRESLCSLQESCESQQAALKLREDDSVRISESIPKLEEGQQAVKVLLKQLGEALQKHDQLLKQRGDDCGRLLEAVSRLEDGQGSFSEKDVQTALAPVREQLASLEQKASENSGMLETRLDANIARSQQRVEQRLEVRLTEVRQDLGKDFQWVKEALESERERIGKLNDQLWSCMEDRERINNFMKNSDLDSMWESFAQLASRLSDVQFTVDDFIFRQNGCRAPGK